MESEPIPRDQDGQEEIGHFIARISTLPLKEQRERLLEYFAESLVDIPTEDLKILRPLFFLPSADVRPMSVTLTEIYDGHLALRSLLRSE